MARVPRTAQTAATLPDTRETSFLGKLSVRMASDATVRSGRGKGFTSPTRSSPKSPARRTTRWPPSGGRHRCGGLGRPGLLQPAARSLLLARYSKRTPGTRLPHPRRRRQPNPKPLPVHRSSGWPRRTSRWRRRQGSPRWWRHHGPRPGQDQSHHQPVHGVDDDRQAHGRNEDLARAVGRPEHRFEQEEQADAGRCSEPGEHGQLAGGETSQVIAGMCLTEVLHTAVGDRLREPGNRLGGHDDDDVDAQRLRSSDEGQDEPVAPGHHEGSQGGGDERQGLARHDATRDAVTQVAHEPTTMSADGSTR